MVPDSHDIGKPQLFNHDRYLAASLTWMSGKNHDLLSSRLLKDEADALCELLKIFSDRRINLTRIESRPQKFHPGQYLFLADFEGSDSEASVKEALAEVQQKATFYKFIGCYPKEER